MKNFTSTQIESATNRIAEDLEWLELSDEATCVHVYGEDYEGNYSEVTDDWREVIASELIAIAVDADDETIAEDPKYRIIFYEDDNFAHGFHETAYNTQGYEEWYLSDLLYILNK